MAAKRKNDIISNLAFAFESNRELSTLISEAQRTDGSVKHISQKAAAILASLRECFDYCASDIKDDYLVGNKQRVYYPFHPDSLNKNKPLNELINTHKNLYQKLLSVSVSIQNSDVIAGTCCLYSDAKAVNDLVNLKKHDRVIEVCELGRSKTRIDFPTGGTFTVSPMFPVGADGKPDLTKPGAVGPEAWVGTPEVKVSAVKDFFFDAKEVNMSRTDVHGFCMTTITATRFILGEVYNAAYGIPHNTFR